ncbi:MAG: DUF4184 family protein [Betaproteobacteria bacterium]|nr:DUF4184 family protein [Betaproteobacteria bacterium]
MFYFCLPYGVLAYLLYHLVLKYPLIALLPEPVGKKVLGVCAQPWRFPKANGLAVVISLLAGAATHVIWDSFTHPGETIVQTLLPLQTELFKIQGASFYVFNVLQHMSTLLGFGLLARWGAHWLRTTPVTSAELPFTLRTATRVLVIALFGTITAYEFLEVAAVALYQPVPLIRLRHWVGPAVTTAMANVGIAVILYRVLWNIAALRRVRKACCGGDLEGIHKFYHRLPLVCIRQLTVTCL